MNRYVLHNDCGLPSLFINERDALNGDELRVGGRLKVTPVERHGKTPFRVRIFELLRGHNPGSYVDDEPDGRDGEKESIDCGSHQRLLVGNLAAHQPPVFGIVHGCCLFFFGKTSLRGLNRLPGRHKEQRLAT